MKQKYIIIHYLASKFTKTPINQRKTREVCRTVALPFTLKSILRQKKNYGNSKYFTMQKYNLQNNPLKTNQKSFKIL